MPKTLHEAAPTLAEAEPVTIPMVADKPCKGSVRYKAADPDAAVTNVYLDRSFANPMPTRITVTVEPA